MPPPAPAWFSMITGWPSIACRRAVTSRDTASVDPPGGTGTTSLMVCSGKVCATAGQQAVAASAAAATMVPGGAAAQAPRAKGPRVWLDMDQKELDDAYDQAVYAPNRDQMSRRRASLSELVRARIGEPKRVAYGP